MWTNYWLQWERWTLVVTENLTQLFLSAQQSFIASFWSLFWFYGPQLNCFSSVSLLLVVSAIKTFSSYLPDNSLWSWWRPKTELWTKNEFECCNISAGYQLLHTVMSLDYLCVIIKEELDSVMFSKQRETLFIVLWKAAFGINCCWPSFSEVPWNE